MSVKLHVVFTNRQTKTIKYLSFLLHELPYQCHLVVSIVHRDITHFDPGSKSESASLSAGLFLDA